MVIGHWRWWLKSSDERQIFQVSSVKSNEIVNAVSGTTTQLTVVSRVILLFITLTCFVNAAPSIPPSRHCVIDIGKLNCVPTQTMMALLRNAARTPES